VRQALGLLVFSAILQKHYSITRAQEEELTETYLQASVSDVLQAWPHFTNIVGVSRLTLRVESAMNFAASQQARFVERPVVTVSYPEATGHSRWYLIDLFIYLQGFRRLVGREINKRRQSEEEEYADVTTHLGKTLPAGTLLRVLISSDHFDVNPEEIALRWIEGYYHQEFRIRPRRSAVNGSQADLKIEVFGDGFPLGEISIPITVLDEHAAEDSRREANMRWFQDVFASYAHEDFEIVQHLKARYAALGIDLYVDKERLRPGDKWSAELLHKIEESDLFQLFWSNAASRSIPVEEEWREAVKLRSVKDFKFLRPVYWEEPMPLRPPDLADTHFHKLTFLAHT